MTWWNLYQTVIYLKRIKWDFSIDFTCWQNTLCCLIGKTYVTRLSFKRLRCPHWQPHLQQQRPTGQPVELSTTKSRAIVNNERFFALWRTSEHYGMSRLATCTLLQWHANYTMEIDGMNKINVNVMLILYPMTLRKCSVYYCFNQMVSFLLRHCRLHQLRTIRQSCDYYPGMCSDL